MGSMSVFTRPLRSSAFRVCASRSVFSATGRVNVFSPRTFQPNISYNATTFIRSFATEEGASLKTPEEITERVLSVVKNFEKVDAAAVTDKSHFSNDLGLDSLDTVELVLAIENEFSIEIPDDAANNLNSVEEAISYLATNPHLK